MPYSRELDWPEDKRNTLGDLLANRVKFCGCGTDRKWHTMQLLLELAARESTRPNGFYDDDRDTPPWFWEFSANCLDSMGLIDHGTGIGFPWLTEDGQLLKEFLQACESGDGYEWPAWAEGDI